MKRHVCTVAVGLALALVSAGPAAASLPGLGDVQTATQSSTFGEQTVDEQKNAADVTQSQGNGNVNVSPAIAVFGDASTENSQGNDNHAKADIDQSNDARQSQDASQSQSLDQSGGSCCDGQSQAGEQKVVFGDQTIGEQKNDADVRQYQGNGNVSVSPAIALGGPKHDDCRSKCDGKKSGKHGGDASTWNSQGNGNQAYAYVDQSNRAYQSQAAKQKQSLVQACKGVI